MNSTASCAAAACVLLLAGRNYGWPRVAGFKDDSGYRYANYSAAPNCEQLEDPAQNGPGRAAGRAGAERVDVR